ncbi:hypothetical protein ACFOYW_16880 [Gryllotalpicola reticulitermitis]|uniref:Uncharacterized protein n=1 Tax=Gryllotalpicola reticulitermitis TaxID=1184153 RepID=A0ABV8QB05_9MICO
MTLIATAVGPVAQQYGGRGSVVIVDLDFTAVASTTYRLSALLGNLGMAPTIGPNADAPVVKLQVLDSTGTASSVAAVAAAAGSLGTPVVGYTAADWAAPSSGGYHLQLVAGGVAANSISSTFPPDSVQLSVITV